jgi:hypothetical protein
MGMELAMPEERDEVAGAPHVRETRPFETKYEAGVRIPSTVF